MFPFLKGGAFDPGIDLLKGLNLHTNISQFDGVSITQGSQKRTAYKLQGNKPLSRSDSQRDLFIIISITVSLLIKFRSFLILQVQTENWFYQAKFIVVQQTC